MAFDRQKYMKGYMKDYMSKKRKSQPTKGRSMRDELEELKKDMYLIMEVVEKPSPKSKESPITSVTKEKFNELKERVKDLENWRKEIKERYDG